MPLPALSNWQNTRLSLHQAAQVIGAIKAAVAQPLPNWAHLGLYVTPQGVTTGTLPIGELRLDFAQRAVQWMGTNGNLVSVPLAGFTQVTLLDAVLDQLPGSRLQPKRDKITSQTPLDVNAALAADYAQTLYTVFTAMARFRARLLGPLSPMIVWPHGFDLSFLWFAGAGMEEKHDPHMNFGFSPGTPGLERPYIYSYAYPSPDGLTRLPLPAGVRWNTTGWTGTVFSYDDFANASDPAALIESTLAAIHQTVSPLLG